jgi:Cyclic nucleotide-binding domain/4Fe-4S binding domain
MSIFTKIPERQMHVVRWLLTSGWLLLILSLFYDPISPWFTEPDRTWSPLRLNLNACVKVQGVCLPEEPYALGAPIFWGAIVPTAIFILLVFGHELWRRICPLSFLSQIPRALGWQRQHKRTDPKNNKVRYELAKVKKDSWLGRNYPYLQFGLLFIGLCSRILFINSDRLALGIWLVATIVAAIAVGYLYGGKSWCQYFCPMAPVQKIYAEPAGLLASKAHTSEQQITQSMCRIVNEEGKEQSACIACQNPCIDIDSERSYWDGIEQPGQKLLYYGYVGLVIGYFGYYYLYAGNWDYYFSGAWAHQGNLLSSLLSPGFYLYNIPIPIPKIIAVPVTLGLFTAGGYSLGLILERSYKSHLRTKQSKLTPEQVQHRVFTLCTYFIFNFFFIFGGRPFIGLLPIAVQNLCDVVIVLCSTLWVYQTWVRNPELYSRESLASRFRKQLDKLKIDISRFIEGRSLEDLNPHELYVLVKVLPGFTKEKRHVAYKGVIRDALEEGYVNTSSSLEVLRQLRQELDISDEEHRVVLEELGVEDPELLNPTKQRTLENSVRLNGYRKALERIVGIQQRQLERNEISDLLVTDSTAIQALRQEYSISAKEEQEILEGFDREAGIVHRADYLLQQLYDLTDCLHALNQPLLIAQGNIIKPLRDAVLQKKRLTIRALLEILENLGQDAEAQRIAQAIGNLAPSVLQDILENHTSEWYARLDPAIVSLLKQPGGAAACSLALELDAITDRLEALLEIPNPLTQAIGLYALYQLDQERSREKARQMLRAKPGALVKQTAETLLNLNAKPENTITEFEQIEKLVCLYNSDFFSGIYSETLIELSNLSYIKVYGSEEVVTEDGDTCRELLLLMEGIVEISLYQNDGETTISSLLPGRMLDELEVLAHTALSGTAIAKATPTRILAIPVDAFDDLLDRDRDFARRVLEMESSRLQQAVLQGNQP